MPQRAELKVAIFLAVSTILIAAAIGYIAHEKGFFAQFTTFTLSSKSGEDITEGMPVLFSGFKIGAVKTLELSENGTVLIHIQIPERHLKWIRTDSTFIVNKPLLGSPRIVVVTENLQSALLAPKQIREVISVSDINETIKKAQPLLERITKIAGNIEIVTARVADPQGEVHQILANAERFTATMAGKKSFLEMAISDQESLNAIYSTLRETKNIATQIDAILKKVDAMTGKTDTVVYGNEGLLANVQVILKDIIIKLEKLNTTIDNVNKISTEAADSTTNLKTLRTQIDETVLSIGDLAKELDQRIPFKKPPEITLP